MTSGDLEQRRQAVRRVVPAANHRHLVAALIEMHFVHERADEHNATSVAFEQVRGLRWIR
jgi:hypothetical protein